MKIIASFLILQNFLLFHSLSSSTQHVDFKGTNQCGACIELSHILPTLLSDPQSLFGATRKNGKILEAHSRYAHVSCKQSVVIAGATHLTSAKDAAPIQQAREDIPRHASRVHAVEPANTLATQLVKLMQVQLPPTPQATPLYLNDPRSRSWGHAMLRQRLTRNTNNRS